MTLSPATLPAGTANTPYNQTITAGGGIGTITLTSSVTSSVPGLTVQASGTGSLTVSGTPTATGTETFTVTATDATGGTLTVTYSIKVAKSGKQSVRLVLSKPPAFGRPAAIRHGTKLNDLALAGLMEERA